MLFINVYCWALIYTVLRSYEEASSVWGFLKKWSRRCSRSSRGRFWRLSPVRFCTRQFGLASSTYASGSLEGTDQGSHSSAGSDGHGERAGLDTSSESSSATTSGTVSPVVGLWVST